MVKDDIWGSLWSVFGVPHLDKGDEEMIPLRKQQQMVNQVRYERLFVTPEMAAEWLRANPTNRPIRKQRVAELVDAIRSGRWHENGQGIIFSKSGRMLNGQHRCLAICSSGIGVWMLVTNGVDDAAMPSIDDGAPRTLADVLVMEGWDPWNSRTGSTAVRYAIALETGKNKLNISIENEIGREFVFSNPEIMSSVEMLQKLPRKPTPMPHSLGAFLHYEMGKLDRDAADDFIRKLWTGENLASGDVVLQLRNSLLGRQLQGGRRKDVESSATAAIRVWNSIRRGKPIRHINNAFRMDGALPRPE
jgi:hypothetical protein